MNKKQEILEAAASLFRTKGYAATSMRDLAKAVHLQASSLYNHISSKEALLEEICFNTASRFKIGIEDIEKRQESPVQKIERLIHLHIDIATNDATSITSFNDEWRHLTDDKIERFIASRKDYESRFRKIIEEGMTNGSLKKSDSSIILYTVISSLRWIHDWYKPSGNVSTEQLKSMITPILLEGLILKRG